MKTLEPPKEQNWKYVWRCEACKAKLEADIDDVQIVAGDRPWETSTFAVRCPHCCTMVYDLSIPIHLQQKVKR